MATKKIKAKNYIVFVVNLLTNEIVIFGEMKLRYPDMRFVVSSLTDFHINCKYVYEEKSYYKANFTGLMDYKNEYFKENRFQPV